MKDSRPEDLLDAVTTLLRLFIVNETSYPSAEGKMRYNGIDFQTLRFIEEHPGCSGAEIAAALGLAPTTQQSALDRLIRQKLVARNASPTDRRSKSYSLTESGMELRRSIHRQDLTNMSAMLGTLTNSEQEELVRLARKVTDGLSRQT